MTESLATRYVRRSQPQTSWEPRLRAGGDLQSTDDSIRIAIVGNHDFVTDGLDALLHCQAGMTVVGNMCTAPDPESQCAALKAEVVILGYHLDDAPAVAAGRTLCAASSNFQVIFLTPDACDKVVLAAIDAGASAVLDTSISTSEVIQAIHSVARGETMISSETVATLLKGRQRAELARDQLTSREIQILGLMADGTSNRLIADLLGISYLTVRTHLRNLATKLAAHNKLEVLVRARQLELVGGREVAVPLPVKALSWQTVLDR